MLLSAAANDITLGQAGVYGLLGYAVVFFGLILLMLLTVIIGKIFVSLTKKQTPQVSAPAPVAAEPVYAPGSAGAFKLHGVDPKTAAMAMAIVADKMGKPLNELRFISVKEVSH